MLPAAAETGVASPTVSRHLPVLRNCVQAGDVTVLVTRCTRPEQPANGCLLLLTTRRLVVTQQTRLLHRLRLHLNTELRHLNNVAWNPDPRASVVELAATAVDGVRERFLIRASRPSQMWQLDALFSQVFRPRMAARSRVAAAAPVDRPTVLGTSHEPRPVPALAATPPARLTAPARVPRLSPVVAA
ncbi:hypothetical protein Pen02_41800 [Plantactinospora endophytica]|uniref:HTH arsR-type domain-containing protein n=1 Tax=Plantactinospora endophytica TaxID=673535 RepID=A0ABQ4E3G6_9ACTN|nr:hypothetical protein Pen02_41800 [Plantactinospora endophytica]